MNAVARPELTLEGFESSEVDPDTFDHEGHVYIGWLYLERYPLPEAIARYCAGLRRLTARLGVPEKYHETITWFFLVMIAERRDRTSGDGWFAFRSENDDLFHAGRMLARYYSKERLMSDRARQTFLLPDRIAAEPDVRTVP